MATSKIQSIPTNQTVMQARKGLDDATLNTLATAAGMAGAALSRMAGTATVLKSSVVDATLRVISKETISDVIEPIKGTIGNAGKTVSNLSTIRTAVLKMAVAYGTAYTLPHWAKVSESKESGDAAVTKDVGACLVYVEGQVPTVNDEMLEELTAKVNALCAMFALSEDSAGKIRGVYLAALQGITEAEAEAVTEAEAEAENQAIKGDAEALILSELEELRDIASKARAMFGMPGASNAELLAEITRTDLAPE